MVKTLHIVGFCILVAICSAQGPSSKGQPLQRATNSTAKLPNGGKVIENKPGKHEMSGVGRSAETQDDGRMKVSNTNTNKAVTMGVSKCEELDSGRNLVCGGKSEYNFDGNDPDAKTPNNETIVRNNDPNGERTNANVDFASELKGGKSSNNVKQSGTIVGDGQKNVFTVGNFSVSQDYLTKTDDGEAEMQIGNSTSKVNKGDTKITITLEGFQGCGGAGGKMCPCMNGGSSTGAYLRVYFQAQQDSGTKKDTAPTENTGTKKQDSTTNDKDFTLPGDDGEDSSRLKMMTDVVIDDGTNLVTREVTVTAATWPVKGGTASGFTIDIPLHDRSMSTKYIFDPTLSENSAAAYLVASTLVVFIASLLQFL